MLQKIKLLLLVSSLTILTSCGLNNKSNASDSEVLTTNDVLTTSDVQEMIKEETDLILLDVRTESEYLSGHIPDSVLLPYDEISKQAEAIFPNKDSKIVVYCRSGRRSAIAAEELASLGYTNIFDFGAISNWTSELTTN